MKLLLGEISMEIAYVTTYNARTLGGHNTWSGLGYYIAQAIKNQSVNLEYIGPIKDRLTLQIAGKFKRHYYKLLKKRYIKDPEPLILKDFAHQVAQKLSRVEADIVLSATINPIAYLECQQPIVFWADATFANTVDFYPQYSNLCEESLRNGHLMENLALEKCKLAIYSSDWAAQTAIDYYKADPAKVKVVPFGANIDSNNTIDEIKDLIASRPTSKCKLLFLGVDWFRKGGDVAFQVAKKLNQLGLSTQLTVVGCEPLTDEPLPDFVEPLGFISKSTQEGRKKINQLLVESHFLILPSLADCTPIVLCEANSLALPCLSTKVGGIPTIIKPDVNGNLFDLHADIDEYCKYILYLFSNYSRYKELALSSFYEYQTRLNWSAAGQIVKKLLMNVA